MKFEIKAFAIFLVTALLLIPTSIYIRDIQEQKTLDQGEPNVPNVQGETDFSRYPAVINIAPNSVIANTLYRFDLSIVDSDSNRDDISVEIEDGPEWLAVSGLSVLGIPGANELGSSKVTLKISDEKQSVFSTFYILVTTGNEDE